MQLSDNLIKYNIHTFTKASNDSIVRNLDSVIRLSRRLSDIQSLDVSINSASFDVCILWLIVSIIKTILHLKKLLLSFNLNPYV